jgi:hypothetical protein
MFNQLLIQMLTSVLVSLYKAGGRPAVVRALTVPKSQVKAVCDKTGTDLAEALAARDKFAKAGAEFAEQMVMPEDEEDDGA